MTDCSPPDARCLFEHEPHATPEERLWGAVLLLAAADGTSQSKRARSEHSEAAAWMDGAGRDFHMVCDMAGRHPDYIKARWNRIRDNNIQIKARRGNPNGNPQRNRNSSGRPRQPLP